MARGPGRLAWNHKALISSRVGRGKRPPPPPAETRGVHRGQAETQPMLPARSAQAPGPQQRWENHFFKPLNSHEKTMWGDRG